MKMKQKLWTGLILTVLLAVLCCGMAMADHGGSCGDHLTWTLTDAGVLTISGTGAMKDYPSETDAPWDSYRSSVKSVIIDNGVTKIGMYAFHNCSNLTNVSISTTVTEIGIVAFSYCSSLKSVSIPASVSIIGYRAFYKCSSLASVTIHNPEATIGDSDYDVFHYNASSLILYGWLSSTAQTYAANAHITFSSLNEYSGQCGDNVRWMFDPSSGKIDIFGNGPMWDYEYSGFVSPFRKITQMKSVVINDGVTSIGNYAFRESDSLSSVYIPGSVKSIGECAFYECKNLTSLSIPKGVRSIQDYAFSDCRGLMGTITIPDSVTSIGKYAFHNCTGMTGVSIPNSVTNIAFCAFHSAGLTSITIPKSVTSIGECAFAYCNSLTDVTIPDGVKSMDEGAFEYCVKLTSVTLPNSLTILGDEVFAYCTSLTNIQVGSGNTAFSSVDGILYNKQQTELVIFPSGLTGSFIIPNSITKIGRYAFAGCSGLVSVTIPSSVKSIEQGAFISCSALSSITIPNAITSIERAAFAACYNLTGISIPNNVTSIGPYAFQRCKKLTIISIPKSVASIDHWAFSECTGLKTVTVHNPNIIFDNEAFGYNASSLTLRGHSGSTAETYANSTGFTFAVISKEMDTVDFNLPNSLTRIESEAFASSSMSVVWIPDTVTHLGSKAFRNCSNLTQIRIPTSITTIPPDVFQGISKWKLTIFGMPGSAAETFANSAGFKFELE